MKKFKYLFITLFFMVFFIGEVKADTYNADYLSVNNLNQGNTYDSSFIYWNNLTPPRNKIESYDFAINQELIDNQTADYYIFNIQSYINQYDDFDGSGYLRCASSGSGVCDIYRITYDKVSVDVAFQYHPKNEDGRWGPVGKCEFLQIGENISTVKCPNVSKGTNYKKAVFTFLIFYDTQMATNWNLNLGISREYNSIVSTETTIVQKQNETNNNLNKIDSSINSSNTSGGESAADDLKNNSAFQDNSGLSSVVSMPLTFVNSLSNSCQPITLNIPYFDVDMQIPCLQSIITEKMPALANLIKIVINGFIIYRVLLDIFQIIRNAKNPEDDRIEVLDL